uniref:DOMON domain-containing protein n=1 Tax=Plectus sambesii TaxID=2011161 RepID=A0A914XDE7_9BILA
MLRFVALVAVCVKLAGSQQCIPVTEMACNSGWSDYTTCIAHDKEMMEGIASYKDQVAQMGCEVPPWYWQATVESKMMRNRAGLMQYRESHNLGPMETVLRMPKMSRRKRDVDYEDDTNFVYQQVDTNNQVSAGCGFCARRIRCCKDFHQSWIDQNMESEVCEEYSDACQVPPMEDGTCDYALAMPKLINDHMDQVPGNNTVIGGRLESRLRDKWMSLLGATEPTMSCTKNGNVCHCCCGNYTAEPTEQGAMVCRRRRGPTGCGPNEVYEECSTSCQATCMEPNPSCAGEECKTIHAGCKCKPGMVRSGVKCIAADQCPPITGNDAMRVQFKADANFAEVVTAEGTTQVTQRWTNQVASATKVDPTRINDVTLTPGSVVVEFTVSSGKPNEPTSQEVADNLQQLVQQNSLPLTDKNGNKLQIVQTSFKNLGSVSPPGTSTPVQPATTTLKSGATTTTQGSESTGSDSTGSAGTGASDTPVTTTVAGATTTAPGATTTTQGSEATGSDSTGSAGTGASDTPVTTTVAGATTTAPGATTTTQESESTGSDSTGSAGTGASDTPVTTTVAGATTKAPGATTTTQESESTGSDSTGSAGTGASDMPVTTTVAGATTTAPAATTTTQESEATGSDSTGSAGTGASDTPVTTTVAGATTTAPGATTKAAGATTTTQGSEGLTDGTDSTGSAGTGSSDTPVTTTVAGATTKAAGATTKAAGATTTTQESESTGSDSTGSAGTGSSDTPVTTTAAGAGATTKAAGATTTTQESESTGSDSTGSAGTGSSDTPVTTTVAGAKTTVAGATTTSASDIPSDPDNSTSILVELTAVGLTGDFWTGIGWSPKGKMEGSDATLIIVKNGVVSVEDRSMGDHQLNGLDAHQNAFLMTGSVNSGVVKATVRITCKQNDDSLNICKDQFYPLYAAAPSALNGGE